MTLIDFARMTVRIVQSDGISEYVPTVVLLGVKEVRAVDGIPDEEDHVQALQAHITRSGWDSKEFFFGVKATNDRLLLGHFIPGVKTAFVEIINEGGNYSIHPLNEYLPWCL